jgi:hypothetical protein
MPGVRVLAIGSSGGRRSIFESGCKTGKLSTNGFLIRRSPAPVQLGEGNQAATVQAAVDDDAR